MQISAGLSLTPPLPYLIYVFKSSVFFLNSPLREALKEINSGYNEFGTISLYTLPPLINSEKSNSENWSQSGYPPSLKK